MDASKRHRDRLRRGGVLVAVALMAGLQAAGSPCRGQATEEIDPTGGLRSRDTAPPPAAGPASREELIREFDLDFNGTLDVNEAAVARARMKRTRQELEAGMEIDPLTGKPRAASEGNAAAEAPQPNDSPVVDPPVRRRRKGAGEPALPGTRVPDASPVKSGTARSATQRPGARTSGADAGSARPWSSLAPSRPGARPGYGTITPKPDLNAGMPRPTLGRGGVPGGGLLPSIRSPAMARPLTPAAPRPTPRRVTADDIGGF